MNNLAASTIRSELNAASRLYPDWQSLIHSPRRHIAVMSEPFLSLVFEGKKTIESRFSLHNIAPYNRVAASDLVFMKAGPIVGCFTVSWIKYLDLTTHPIEEIKQLYDKEICGTESFWKEKASKRYVTLLGIENVRPLTPTSITKHDRRGWIVL
jgi:hypothetical protein